jgi:hypothetical protein
VLLAEELEAAAAFALLVDELDKELEEGFELLIEEPDKGLEEGFELLVEEPDVKTPEEAGIVLPVASEVGVGVAI